MKDSEFNWRTLVSGDLSEAVEQATFERMRRGDSPRRDYSIKVKHNKTKPQRGKNKLLYRCCEGLVLYEEIEMFMEGSQKGLLPVLVEPYY